jgi:hypothetical protein
MVEAKMAQNMKSCPQFAKLQHGQSAIPKGTSGNGELGICGILAVYSFLLYAF